MQILQKDCKYSCKTMSTAKISSYILHIVIIFCNKSLSMYICLTCLGNIYIYIYIYTLLLFTQTKLKTEKRRKTFLKNIFKHYAL